MTHLRLKIPSMVLGFMLAISLITLNLVATSPTASAQTSFSQCNGTDNVGGQAVECHYVVTNNLNGSTTSSTVTLTECHGAANDPPTLVCSTSTTGSTDLVTTIDQCNGSGNGGGGTVRCTVEVINNITTTRTPTSATVNQCNSSGTGGGTAPTVLCDPFPANTTGATVTQCNGSGNGGGGTRRVRCTVDSDSTTTSLLRVTVNQCNGSGNGGGATVICRTGLTDNIIQPSPGPSPGPSTTSSPTPSTSTSPGGGSGGGSGGGGDNGRQVSPVPHGGVDTGGGSTGGAASTKLMLLGFLVLAFGATTLFLRRRAGANEDA